MPVELRLHPEAEPEYKREDLGTGMRGKYHAAYQEGTNVVLLEPDVAKAFPDSKAVNKALREYLDKRSD